MVSRTTRYMLRNGRVPAPKSMPRKPFDTLEEEERSALQLNLKVPNKALNAELDLLELLIQDVEKPQVRLDDGNLRLKRRNSTSRICQSPSVDSEAVRARHKHAELPDLHQTVQTTQTGQTGTTVVNCCTQPAANLNMRYAVYFSRLRYVSPNRLPVTNSLYMCLLSPIWTRHSVLCGPLACRRLVVNWGRNEGQRHASWVAVATCNLRTPVAKVVHPSI